MVRLRGDADPAGDRRRWLTRTPSPVPDAAPRATLTAACLAVAVLMLNVTGPTVALQAIGEGTGASFASLQWVIGAYAMCLAVFQLGAGRLADRMGRRRVFLISLLLFAAASALCAAAPGPAVLIGGRALQGVAAAAITASSLALLAREFTGAARSRAIGVWGATLAVSFAAGPVLGGWLVDSLDWRSLFAVGILPCLLAAAIARGFVRESRDPASAVPDVAGAASAAVCVFAIMLALLRGNALGWSSPLVVAAGGIAATSLLAFIAIERRRRAPMLDLRLFANRTFDGASLLVFLMSVANFGAFVYLAYFLVVARGLPPVEAGFALAPAAVTTAAVSWVSGHRLDGVPLARRFAAGQALLAVGLLLLSGVDSATPVGALVPGLVLSGAGVGFTNPLSAQAHLAVLPPEHSGIASAINNTARQLGVALGTALMGVILESRVVAELRSSEAIAAIATGSRAELVARLAGPDPGSALGLVPEAARPAVEQAYEAAYADGLGLVMVVGAAIAAAGVLVGALMVRERDLRPEPVVAGSRGDS